MYFIRSIFLFLLLILLSFVQCFAHQKEPRILFLVDASGSMNLPWLNETPRFEAAQEIIIELMEHAQLESNQISFGVRVFGADYPAIDENCFDTQLEVPFRYQNLNQIKARMRHITPQGASPIAYSLEKAAQDDFNELEKYDYSLILITDGEESCQGDICAIMEQLLSKRVSFKPYIISLVNDGPLENLYSCLGDYSVVENRNDITTIVRRILIENESVLKINPRIQSSNRPPLPTSNNTPTVINEPTVTNTTSSTIITPETIIESPSLTRVPLKLKKFPLFVKATPMSTQLTRKQWKTFKKPIAEKTMVPEEEVPTQTIITHNPTPIAGPLKTRTPIIEVEEVQKHTTLLEESEKTYVEVYFVTNLGKHYWTEPLVKISNSETKDTILSFNRHVNGQQVKPIEIPAGTYDFTIPNSKSSAKNVNIIDQKINKVYIQVQTGSLAFYHPEDPKVSVSQYQALVSKTFERNGKVTTHPCDETLPYDPSNYHIEINTLPPLMYNLDINFTSLKLVAIPQPGFIQISNLNRIGEVEFYTLRGNRYIPFHKIMINGNPEEQILEFLPGRYQVRYYKGAQHSGQGPEVVSFTVSRKETTTIHLSQ